MSGNLMLCIKCKREINNNLLRCNYCHTKVQTVCPVCKTLNPLKAEYCSNCSLQLIKYCPECKSANLPSAIECRKCHHDFREDIFCILSHLADLHFYIPDNI